MPNALRSGIRAYTSAIKSMPYSQSMFAQALADTSKFRYSEFGEYTAVREITGEAAGNYDGCKGFSANCIDLDVWSEFKAEFDREISYSVDYLDEINSILRGMELTGTLKLKASWQRLGPEVDAVSCATIYNQIPSGNQHSNTETGYQTDKANIIQTLIDIDNRLYDMGVYGDVAVMMASNIATNLSVAIKEANGLASGAMLAPVTSRVERQVNFRGEDYFEDGLHFKYEVLRFQSRLFIYKVPKQCMIDKVLLLDKKTDGQTAGGWVPDTGYKPIDLLIVPTEAAALSVRHIVSSLTVPLNAYNVDKFNVNDELSGLNQMYDGQVILENIGIDQTGDRFSYKNRIKYGAAVFSVLAHTIIGIHGAVAATPSVNTVSVDPGSVDSNGGGVVLTVSGSNLTGAISQLFTKSGDLGSEDYKAAGPMVPLSGSPEAQVGIINIPANGTGTNIEYIVRVSTDHCSTWNSKTATVNSLA